MMESSTVNGSGLGLSCNLMAQGPGDVWTLRGQDTVASGFDLIQALLQLVIF